MSLKPGSQVKLSKLNKSGTVLSIQGQTVRVLVGDLTISCHQDDLEQDENVVKKPKAEAIVRPKASKHVADNLDLHGFTGAEAQSALEQYFSDVLLADKRVVEIIHGFGTGRVQKVVHDFLSQAEFVGKFELSEFNRGTTRVYLKKISGFS